jgi:hypothetical protein
VRAANASAHFARLAYQRLALAMEERRFEDVLELAPAWANSCRELGLFQESLKCRFLEGIACRETGYLERAAGVFEEIYEQALGSESKLLAPVANNLAQVRRLQGDAEGALRFAGRRSTC